MAASVGKKKDLTSLLRETWITCWKSHAV